MSTIGMNLAEEGKGLRTNGMNCSEERGSLLCSVVGAS